jgi:hypothetical protein
VGEPHTSEPVKRFDETTGVTSETDTIKPGAENTAVLPLDAKFEIEVGTEPARTPNVAAKSPTEKTTGVVPLSTTVVEPPIFDGGLRPDEPDDDDDGLDEDEPATEIALNLPEHMPVPEKEKVPLAMRRPVRAELPSTELPRANSGAPAPLRPGPRMQLPGSPTSSGMGAAGAREVTPASSPLMPTSASLPMSPPTVSSRNTPPGTFAGVDPVAVAAGFHQQRGNVDPTFQGLQLTNEPEIGSLRTGRRSLVIIGVGISIVVAGLLAMNTCGDDSRSSPAATPPDAEVEVDADTPVDASMRPARDAGVRDAGVRDASAPEASRRDAGPAPAKRPPPKRPPPKRKGR